MSAAAYYRVGQLVQLLPRELPHTDDREWWWRIIHVTETSLNVEHEGKFRLGVPFSSVLR